MPRIGYLCFILLSLILSYRVCYGRIIARIVDSVGSIGSDLAGNSMSDAIEWDLEEEKQQILSLQSDTVAGAVWYLREEILCISAIILLVIISRLLSAKKRKRNVYIVKSKKWRDEYGYRVAVVASVLVDSKKNDIAFLPSAPDKRKQANNSQNIDEDFWLLLMSEVEPPVKFDEGGIRKTKKVSKHKKSCK